MHYPRTARTAMLLLGIAWTLLLTERPGAWAQTDQTAASVSGELKQWHKVTVDVPGPRLSESSREPNPFTDFRMDVEFAHESGESKYRVPGYFAADGNAGETSAQEGNVWRAHFAPDRTGKWRYTVHFVKGPQAAISESGDLEPVDGADGLSGEFHVAPSDKSGRDFRARGRLDYVGKHHLQFAGSKEFFLKAGADAPETLLAYEDFDGTKANKKAAPLKSWQPHVRDWRPGDPVWQGDKGKGLIGAVNYLAAKGLNSMSFLPYNAGGDGDNVWPFIARDDKLHYDCSKLDQWGVVMDHATAHGIYLHFKMQENEIDDDRVGHELKQSSVPESLDGGKLGPERKLYIRELVARFGHALALNWNLGEENTQSTEEIRDMAKYIRDTDPYDHHIVVHTFPDQQDAVYPPLLGDGSVLTGASLQNSWQAAHRRTLNWIRKSDEAGQPWVVANDEQNPADMGVPPDPGYQGHSGEAKENGETYTMHDVRKRCLWGTLMAGGAGVEYYFGYQLPEHDLKCEDFRSRDRSWDFCRIALEFFQENDIPFERMSNADELVGNAQHDNSLYCLTDGESVHLVYLPEPQEVQIDLSDAKGQFTIQWYDPLRGGDLQSGSVGSVSGGAKVGLGKPPGDAAQDWLVLLRPATEAHQ